MGAIAEIFRKFGPEYLAKYGDAMPTQSLWSQRLWLHKMQSLSSRVLLLRQPPLPDLTES